jgi:hypothetical protein
LTFTLVRDDLIGGVSHVRSFGDEGEADTVTPTLLRSFAQERLTLAPRGLSGRGHLERGFGVVIELAPLAVGVVGIAVRVNAPGPRRGNCWDGELAVP